MRGCECHFEFTARPDRVIDVESQEIPDAAISGAEDDLLNGRGCSFAEIGYLDRCAAPCGIADPQVVQSDGVTRSLTPEEVAATLPGNRNYTNSLNIANYFRLTPDNRLLFGGRAKFSAASNQKADGTSGELLRKQMLDVFPRLAEVEIDYCWGGLVGCTQDRYPRAGTADGLIYGMGYSGHGGQLSTLIGGVLADIARAARIPTQSVAWTGMPSRCIPASRGSCQWWAPIIG
ncbi:hypothetical protein MES5069_460039 [Mesorhizobium escarrei]|uniref:FAD dependent oxidoreductase domain-containing protein n=1 Tax=Mesorhizobium escarrei TaxID=666018 RepID=A0ABM9E901_9HYPH|nr:hypothetical protein MES5069_460039 [Mesorhizobium escarrei]